MARRARMIKRNEVMPDAKYQSLTVSKLMNRTCQPQAGSILTNNQTYII